MAGNIASPLMANPMVATMEMMDFARHYAASVVTACLIYLTAGYFF
jgi:hypothetical protein